MLGSLQMEVIYPIHVAAQLGDALILRQLLELGVDPETGAAEGRTPMDFAAEADSNGPFACRRAENQHVVEVRTGSSCSC